MFWKLAAAFIFVTLNLPSPGVDSTAAFVPLLFGRVQTAMRGALHTVRADLKANQGARPRANASAFRNIRL
jgi:hypothetical protein